MPSENHPTKVVLLTGGDTEAVEALRPAAELLESFGVAIRTALVSAATSLDGLSAIIVAAPDASLAAALADETEIPVIRVPTETADRRGLALLRDGSDNLPAGSDEGVFATMAIGAAGAKNAALFVVSILALDDERLRAAYADFRARQTRDVLAHPPLALEP